MRILKAGNRLKSAVCDTEVMVIRAEAEEILVNCGGVEMIGMEAQRMADARPMAPFTAGTLVGKRYVDAADRLELLCTKSGKGSLSVGDEPLVVKQAKALPSSD